MAKKASKSTSRRHPLAEVLAARGQQMAPTQLLAEAGYNEESIEDFYAALRKEIHQGLIHELRPSESDVILEAITP